MTPLEEYKNKQAVKEGAIDFYEGNCEMSFKNGFDAALALELPVKFAEWKDKNAQQLDYFPLVQFSTNKELYEYWEKNILKLEV